MNDADDRVDRAAHDRDARVLGLDEQVEEDGQGRGDVDPDDVGARRHDLAHARVAEVHDRHEELLLVLLENPLLAADVDVGLDLLLGRVGGLLRDRGAAREDAPDQEREREQQPRRRRDERQQALHDPLGVAVGVALDQADLRQQPARHEERAAPQPGPRDLEGLEGRHRRQQAGQEQGLDEDLRRRPHDLDLSGAREQARALRVLLEEAADLDRREPVERQREGLEEQERAVAEDGRGDGDHRATFLRTPVRTSGRAGFSRRELFRRSPAAGSAMRSRRRRRPSIASISPSSVSWS